MFYNDCYVRRKLGTVWIRSRSQQLYIWTWLTNPVTVWSVIIFPSYTYGIPNVCCEMCATIYMGSQLHPYRLRLHVARMKGCVKYRITLKFHAGVFWVKVHL